MKKILKKVYDTLPLKKELFSLIKKVYHPEETVYRHLHFKGVFRLPVLPGKSLLMNHYGHQLENDLFWKGLTGRWEKKSMEIWMELSKQSHVVLDIGANTGIYGLVSKTINPGATVVAYEPVQRVFKKLEANIALNNYKIIACPDAVSDHCGEATFYDTDAEHTYTVTIGKDLSADKNYHPVQVAITTLDEIVKVQRLQKIDLIKIDVETHEPEVLKGFTQINEHQPAILIEILSDEIGRQVQEEIEKHTQSYLYFDIDEEKGPQLVDKIGKSTGMNYLLCNKATALRLGLTS